MSVLDSSGIKHHNMMRDTSLTLWLSVQTNNWRMNSFELFCENVCFYDIFVFWKTPDWILNNSLVCFVYTMYGININVSFLLLLCLFLCGFYNAWRIHWSGEFLISSPGMVVVLRRTELGNWLISWFWKSSLRSYSLPRWINTLFWSHGKLTCVNDNENALVYPVIFMGKISLFWPHPEEPVQ